MIRWCKVALLKIKNIKKWLSNAQSFRINFRRIKKALDDSLRNRIRERFCFKFKSMKRWGG
jgi:hypothetical protein